MKREEIMRLAKGIGFDDSHANELERFANLIATIEREKVQHQIEFLLKAYDSVSNQLSKATGKQSKDVREAIKARSKE